jgi:hypothetical protein
MRTKFPDHRIGFQRANDHHAIEHYSQHLIWKKPEFVENRVGVTVTDDPTSG